MPVYVDIPAEYGKTWLKDLVTGNASFFDFVAVRRLNKIKIKKTTCRGRNIMLIQNEYIKYSRKKQNHPGD